MDSTNPTGKIYFGEKWCTSILIKNNYNIGAMFCTKSCLQKMTLANHVPVFIDDNNKPRGIVGNIRYFDSANGLIANMRFDDAVNEDAIALPILQCQELQCIKCSSKLTQHAIKCSCMSSLTSVAITKAQLVGCQIYSELQYNIKEPSEEIQILQDQVFKNPVILIEESQQVAPLDHEKLCQIALNLDI